MYCNVYTVRFGIIALDPKKRRTLQFDIGLALHTVIKQYFDVDSCGLETDMGMTADGLILLMGARKVKYRYDRRTNQIYM